MKNASTSTLTDAVLPGEHHATRARQPRSTRVLRTWLAAVPLALLVIAAFIPILNNGFVDWDDDQNFLKNPNFHGLGPAQFKWAWTTFWVGAYQPLAWILFEAQYALWKLDPYGYHLTSIALHAVNTVVLYVLTVTLLRRCQPDLWCKNPSTCAWSAGLATALFMVHPLRVEAVAWVSCQPYLPCALFATLALLAYLHAFSPGSSPRRDWLAASFVLFLASLLFKAAAVSLPVVLLILDVYPLRRLSDHPRSCFGAATRRVLFEKAPFAIVSLVFMALAIAAKPQSWSPVTDRDASAGIAQACYAPWFYIQKTLLPFDLIAIYPLPAEINWLVPRFMLSILATLGVSVGLILLRRRWLGLLAAWLSYLVILAPNSGLVRIGKEITADRYSYMAMLGWAIVLAACLCRLGQSFSRSRLAAMGTMTLGLVALIGLILVTRAQCRTWHDSQTFWTHAVTHGAGSSPRVHCGLGSYFEHRENDEAAMAEYALALRLDPTDAAVHNSLGVILSHQGKYAEAAAQHAEALRLDPRSVNAHYNLGVILSRQGRDAEAAVHYTKALRLNPAFVDAHNNLGVILSRQGRDAEAAAHHATALQWDPHSAKAHNNLGIILSRQQKYQDAAAHYREALRLEPADASTHYNLGTILSRQQKYQDAAAHYFEALRLNPDLANAHNNLGTDLFHQGKLGDAEAHYVEALRLDPGRADTHTNLGVVLSRQGKLEEAATHYAEALRLDPNDHEAKKNLELDQARRRQIEGPATQ